MWINIISALEHFNGRSSLNKLYITITINQKKSSHGCLKKKKKQQIKYTLMQIEKWSEKSEDKKIAEEKKNKVQITPEHLYSHSSQCIKNQIFFKPLIFQGHWLLAALRDDWTKKSHINSNTVPHNVGEKKHWSLKRIQTQDLTVYI